MSHFFTSFSLTKATRGDIDVGDQPDQTSKVILAFSFNLAFLGSSNLTHVSIYRVKQETILTPGTPKGKTKQKEETLVEDEVAK